LSVEVSTASERLKNRAPVRLLSVTLLCELLAARLQCLQQAGALTPEEARVSGAVLQRRSLLDQLRAFRKPLAILEAEIQTGFAVHPEAALFRDVHAGGAPMTPQLARRVVQFFSNQPAGDSAVSHLTAGERDFLDHLAKGYAYKEIADRLSISIDTVRSYVRTVYEKLHVHSRTEAVVKYLRG
jgi:DNA-binding CsgD family transcriptional regulator